MIDLTTYALLRKQITSAASGVSDVRAEGDELVFVLADGREVRVAIPATEIRDAVVRDDMLVLTLEDDKEVVVDTTLTQSGQAADAKVTGDVVSRLKDDIAQQHNAIKRKIEGHYSNQMFDKTKITQNVYINPANGSIVENTNFVATDYIPVEVNKTYICTTKSNCAFYKADKSYAQSAGSVNPFTVPAGVAFIRCSINKNAVDTFMFNEGETLLPYDEFGNKLTIDNFSDALIVELEKEMGVSNIKREIENKVEGKKTAQMFDKSAVTIGKYVSPANGALIDNANFSASDFIAVEAGKTYICTTKSNCAYYKVDKTYLQSAGSDNPFTVPANAAYIRCSIGNASLSSFMFNEGSALLPYEDFGTKLTSASFDDDVITYLKEVLKTGNDTFDYGYLYHMRNHLNNPFVKTQIKLVGDSITAGQAGTGYSPTGEAIGGSDILANVLTATCWSNMFYHYIDEVFNKITDVPLDDNSILKSASASVSNSMLNIGGVNIYYKRILENNTVSGREVVEFDFYGDEVVVYHEVGSDRGIFAIYIDDELKQTVDCYGETHANMVEKRFNGLEMTNHRLSIRCTATRNPNATMNQIVLQRIKVRKVAIVKPWGISGTTSESAMNNNGRFSNEDDFVILQYGTNDRHMHFSKWHTVSNLIAAGEMIRDTYGAEPIFMASCPSNNHYDSSEDVERFYHMWDIRDAIADVANHFSIPFIDNYTAFQEYAEQHNITTDDLLADGLHPNDLGYKVMFMNIMKSLGLARLPYYKEWLHS